jgi:hypothetical protein
MITLSVSDVLLAALSASALIFGFVLQWRREDRLATLQVDHNALALPIRSRQSSRSMTRWAQ